MRLLILTEGFHDTGYGHVTRCMAISQAFQARGIEVVFLVNGDMNVVSMLQNYTLLTFNWLYDVDRLKDILGNVQLVLIDSYMANLDLYMFVHKYVSVCVYLDDFNRLEYPSGIIVNGTVGAELIVYPKKENQIYLLGKDYVILREPFKYDLQIRSTEEKIRSILISFGGTDPLNLTTTVLSNVLNYFGDVKKIIILGAAFSHVDEIKALADKQTELYYNVDAETMKRLMQNADLAISAAGQTINELAITGLPSIIFKVADNQDNNISGWMRFGFIESYIDATRAWSSDCLIKQIEKMEDPAIRIRVSELGKKVIDGKGCERLVKKTLSLYCQKNLFMAKAREKDLLPLFKLANDRIVRQNSFSVKNITLSEHVEWFNATLHNPNRRLYVFYLSEIFVGQIRFDREDRGHLVISISLDAFYRGWGLASFMLQKAINELKKDEFGMNMKIYAYVKDDNKSSQYTFLKAGFHKCINDENNVLKFVYDEN